MHYIILYAPITFMRRDLQQSIVRLENATTLPRRTVFSEFQTSESIGAANNNTPVHETSSEINGRCERAIFFFFFVF